jgi:hypothetical protein
MDILHAVLAVDDELSLVGCRTAECGMQDSAVLGRVDVDALEHLVATLLEVHRTSESDKVLDRLIGHKVLGKVEVKIVHVEAELVHTLRIVCEPLLERDALIVHLLEVPSELLPLRSLGRINRCCYVGHGIPPCLPAMRT